MSYVEILLNIELFILVVVLQMEQCGYPTLFDELIVAGELPSHHFLRVPWSEIEVFIDKGASDVLSFQHVFGLEFDGEVGGCGFEAIDSIYMQDLNGAFGELVELFEDFDVIACKAFGDVGIIIEMSYFDDEQSAVAGDAGWVNRRILRLFLVTMLAS